MSGKQVLAFLNLVLDLVSPERCRVCRLWRAAGTGPCRSVCSGCWPGVIANGCPIDYLKGDDGLVLTVVSGAPYEGPLKGLIYKLKYDGDRLIAADLALIAVRSVHLLGAELTDPAILVPVPLHKSRLRQRGFNQSELIASSLARLLGIKADALAISRLRDTKPQHGLGRMARLANVGGAFAGKRKSLEGQTVILVDDVCTSGATLLEAARACLAAGARHVLALTVARAIRVSDREANLLRITGSAGS